MGTSFRLLKLWSSGSRWGPKAWGKEAVGAWFTAPMEGYYVHSNSFVSSIRRATRPARTPSEARLLPSELARTA